MDALDALEGDLLMLHTGCKSVTNEATSVGLQLERHYDAAIADGGDKSTTSRRVTLETFGRVTRLGLHMYVPRGTGLVRRDAYTTQLEQQVQTIRQQSEADRQRIASLEAAQIEMQQQFMTQFMAS